MSELIDDELIDKVLDVIRDKFPKAFDNPKDYPEDINNAKVEIRKLLKPQQPIGKRKLTDDKLVVKIVLLVWKSIDKPEFHDACNDWDFKEDYFKTELSKLLQEYLNE